jgi:hypothetical protein
VVACAQIFGLVLVAVDGWRAYPKAIVPAFRRKIRRQVGLSYLYKLNYSLQQPRPHHASADKQAQAEFKKNSPHN